MTARRIPVWQVIVPIVLLVAIFGFIWAVYIRSGNTNAAVNATNASSARRDCVTTIATARTAVFNDVQIDTAISTQILNGVLLNQQVGLPLSADEKASIVKLYGTNNAALTAALVEARRLQPSKTLDDLIAHGGMVAGKHYDACPG